MAHPQPLKDVARQAGVGLATVDRVIHGRGGVRATTEARVRQAMDELARQTLQATAAGRRFAIDLVMDAPARFTGAVQAALEAELPALLPAAFRVRAHLSETATAAELRAVLAAIGRRGSHGVLLKAPDDPGVGEAVERLAAHGIPVVTLVTDLSRTTRLAYVGMDNRAAGRTAALLLARFSGAGPAGPARGRGGGDAGAVLVTLSSRRFAGEEERQAGFAEALAALRPAMRIVAVSEGRGRDRETGALVGAALAADRSIRAVYSIGGGNDAIVAALGAARRRCDAFVAHDLDAVNRRLLADGAIDAVLVHDLRADMRRACRLFLEAHRVLPRGAPDALSAVGIVTRFNLPG